MGNRSNKASNSNAGHVDQAEDSSDAIPEFRPCQKRCLDACLAGARVIEMACGTGKTRVMQELAQRSTGRVLVLVPSRLLLRQHMPLFPEFCPVGTGYNHCIRKEAPGFIAVSDSVELLADIEFADMLVDEGHHPMPAVVPKANIVVFAS